MAAFKEELPPVRGLDQANKPSTLQPELQTQSSQSIEALKDIAFGSTAGVLGKFIEYPFDTVKVRLQSQPTDPTRRQPRPSS